MKFCTKCGAQIADESLFCTQCGATVGAPQQPQTPPQPTYTPPQPTYTPPQQSYVPPQQGYVPPQQGYVPPQQPYGAPQQPYGAPQQPYGAPQQPAGYPIGRSPVKTDYSLVTYILLSLITLGIYGYYIIYKLAQDVNQICSEDGDSVGGLGMFILLSLVTCGLYSLFWLYKIQNRMYNNSSRYNVFISENGTTVLTWYLIGSLVCGIGGFVAMNIIFKSANKLGMAYNAIYFRR